MLTCSGSLIGQWQLFVTPAVQFCAVEGVGGQLEGSVAAASANGTVAFVPLSQSQLDECVAVLRAITDRAGRSQSSVRARRSSRPGCVGTSYCSSISRVRRGSGTSHQDSCVARPRDRLRLSCCTRASPGISCA